MSASTLAGVMVCLLVLIAPARCARGDAAGPAALREGIWGVDLKSALDAARFSGRPVLIFFAEDWCGYCEAVEKVLVHPEVREATKRFWLVKLKVDEQPELAHRYKVELHHELVMLDWSGAVIGRVKEMKSAQDLALTVIEAAASSDLAGGTKLCDLGQFRKAAERYHLVMKITRSKETVQRAKAGLATIREQCKRRINMARDLAVKGRKDEAEGACREIIVAFPPESGTEEAKVVLAQLRANKPVDPPKEAVKEPVKPTADVVAEAQRLLEEGMVHEWDKQYLDALDDYRKVTRDYPAAPAAAEAKKRTDLLLSDPEAAPVIEKGKADRQCQGWLDMAKQYEEAGKLDDAKKYYEKIAATYPDSPQADEARKRLRELK